MALWGKSDLKTGPAGQVTVVGTASSEFWTVGGPDFVGAGITTGDTVLLGTPAGSEGFVTIERFFTNTLARVGKMSGVGTDVNQAFDAAYCDQPISLKNDPGYAESSADGSLGRTQVLAGVTTDGMDKTTPDGSGVGIATVAGGFHAGWVGIMTYVDMHGNLRTKTETFVAASGIQTGNRPFPLA